MKLMTLIEYVQRQRSNVVASTFRLLTVLFFLGVLAEVPVLAGYSYSDSWLSTSGSVWGCGVTQLDYSGPGHSAGVSTTISSPSGRSASYGASGGSYARVDVSLPLLASDFIGTYTTTSDHYGYCPHYGGSSVAPNTSTLKRYGISWSVYRRGVATATNVTYNIDEPCDVHCKRASYDYPLPFPPGKAPEKWLRAAHPYEIKSGGAIECLDRSIVAGLYEDFFTPDPRPDCENVPF